MIDAIRYSKVEKHATFTLKIYIILSALVFETTKFCHFCGTGPLEEVGDYFHCSICDAAFRIVEVKEPQLTLEEAQAAFDKIPLTDNQRGHKISSPRKKKA